jgi:hypothetical protein
MQNCAIAKSLSKYISRSFLQRVGPHLSPSTYPFRHQLLSQVSFFFPAQRSNHRSRRSLPSSVDLCFNRHSSRQCTSTILMALYTNTCSPRAMFYKRQMPRTSKDSASRRSWSIAPKSKLVQRYSSVVCTPDNFLTPDSHVKIERVLVGHSQKTVMTKELRHIVVL